MRNLAFNIVIIVSLFVINSCAKQDIMVDITDQQYANEHPLSPTEAIINDIMTMPVPKQTPSASAQAENNDFTVVWTDQEPTDPKFTYLDALPSLLAFDEQEDSPCFYGDCDEVITTMEADLREHANATCEDQYYAITCCFNESPMYAMIVVRHQCFPVDNSDYRRF